MPTTSRPENTPRTLAAAQLPGRVRKALELALALVSQELDNGLARMLEEFEQELFRLADQARNPGQMSGYMETLRTFRTSRSDLVPHFMLELEASLAAIRTPPAPAPEASDPAPFSGGFGRLSLVDEAVMDENTVLHEIATRQEGRANLALHLLGQRFGVLAGTPAFDGERLPLGPQALCRAIRAAAHALEIEHDSRLLLYRIFDRHVMSSYARVLERLDEQLDHAGILPGLTFVPVRTRPAPVARTDRSEPDADEPARQAGPAGDTPASPPAASPDGARTAPPPGPQPSGAPRGGWRGPRPYTAWPGDPPGPEEEEDESVALEKLTRLLAGRRELLGKLRPDTASRPRLQLSTDDVFSALRQLQAQSPSTPGAPQTFSDIKQILLAQARQRHGTGADLSPQDNDAFELLQMLFTHLEEEIRRDAPAAALVRRLQVPLLRLALLDRSFFVRSRHPARQLLDTVAGNAARWLDDSDFDPQFLIPLQQAVNHVVEHYDGDASVFAASNERLQAYLQAQVRKAELLEKRHAEAARGKEKLEIAKLRAAEAMERIIGDRRLPKFTLALLNQAWADVLTLTLLRQGEESDAWLRQLEATKKIVEAGAREDATPDPELAAHIESSLGQVGYHGEEASVIARRLAGSGQDEDSASRTELAMKLKARTRLGEDSKAARPKLPPRTPEEQQHYEQLRSLPFGTWIEFQVNQQGDMVRRRLSWYSTVTDNALFVNQHGQRVGEQSLDAVAHLLARGQARIVTADRASLVDRAWQATVNALRSFAGLGGGDASGKHDA